MKNPLLEQHELPPFDVIKPEHIVPALTRFLLTTEKQLAVF